jgi:O-antigen/teichoic acid export membrane protein
VLDKTMIGLITQSANENGYYEQAIKIARMALTVVTALGTVMIPRIGYHFEKGETDTVKDYMYRSYRFVWLLAIPLCLGLIMISDNFVLWFFGDGYEPVIPLMKILALLILAIGINTVTGNQYLIPTKREKAYTFTVVIGAVVNFVSNLILIYYFKAIGAAIASVLAELTIVIVQFVVVRKELSIWNIVKTSGKYLLAGGLMASLLWFENRWLTSSVLNTCIMIVSGATVYFLALLAWCHALYLLENFSEIRGALEARAVGYLLDGHIGGEKKLLCRPRLNSIVERDGCFAGLSLDEGVKARLAHSAHSRKIGDVKILCRMGLHISHSHRNTAVVKG